jgi:hypothetical protein
MPETKPNKNGRPKLEIDPDLVVNGNVTRPMRYNRS